MNREEKLERQRIANRKYNSRLANCGFYRDTLHIHHSWRGSEQLYRVKDRLKIPLDDAIPVSKDKGNPSRLQNGRRH